MAPRGGYTSPENMRIILDVVKYLRASGFVIDAGRGNSQFLPPQSPIGIRNDSGVEIPAFGCVQCSGTVEAGGNNWIKVVKPVDTTGSAGGYLFNGIAPVEIGGYGIAHDGPECRMLTDGSAITCGANWQPNVGAFAIEPGGSNFSAIGADDIGTNVMRGLIKAGGGGGTLQGTLTALANGTGDYTGKKVATITAVVAPCGRDTLIGTSVSVVDWSGCVLDKTEAQLMGVWVWASECVAESLDPGADPGQLTPCHWGADDRCCVAADTA